ncbi:MBL fold metallo-hydrolase [Lacinutrix jangbogonensis]|uniref:MBL fold metallo-hydrolase n=1 Tax=Lacinutrix jangbogonensis TaxID=1469557 RepID=UPI00053DC142|nr:MBL fold metallo-hydrolase [Lacinutrix jangbogonensis]
MARITTTFYGTRGSIPICDPKYLEFGGNTTCIAFLMHSTNRISILDAGTGIRALGKHINENFSEQSAIDIAFTHFHWDHIQGLPFFDPAYNPNRTINIAALGEGGQFTDLRKIFKNLMIEEYFPIQLENMGAKFNFDFKEDNIYENKGILLKTIKQNHPGGSFGYRLEVEGCIIVVCTDLEHGDTINEDIVAFAKDADLLIHEAQYTDEELLRHKGWGHSSFNQAIEVAERAGAKQLIMTHHDPDHDDECLRKIEKECQARFKNCSLAREGMSIEL